MQYILGGVYNPNKEHLLLEFKKFCLNKIPLDDFTPHITGESVNSEWLVISPSFDTSAQPEIGLPSPIITSSS